VAYRVYSVRAMREGISNMLSRSLSITKFTVVQPEFSDSAFSDSAA